MTAPGRRALVLDDSGVMFAKKETIFGESARFVDVRLLADFFDAVRPDGLAREHDWAVALRPDRSKLLEVLAPYGIVVSDAIDPRRSHDLDPTPPPTGDPRLDHEPSLPAPDVAGLDVALAIGTLPRERRPAVIVYSVHMTRPEIAVPLAELGHVVAARYTARDILELDAEGAPRLRSIVQGHLAGGLTAPSRRDWDQLGVPAGFKLVQLLKDMRDRHDVWHRVCHGDTPAYTAVDSATRNIRYRLQRRGGQPVLAVRPAIDLVRRLAFLDATPRPVAPRSSWP